LGKTFRILILALNRLFWTINPKNFTEKLWEKFFEKFFKRLLTSGILRIIIKEITFNKK